MLQEPDSTMSNFTGDRSPAGYVTLLTSMFHQLEGTWKLDRQVDSSNATEPSGRCKGVATFSVRLASDVEGLSEQNSKVEEMLYHEQGEFEMKKSPDGRKYPPLPFSREYVWRLTGPKADSSDVGPTLSVWFTKPGTDELDYLFHEVQAPIHNKKPRTEGKAGSGVYMTALGKHLCVQDMYNSSYHFHLIYTEPGTTEESQHPTLTEWQTEHSVKGPKKDQLIKTSFKR